MFKGPHPQPELPLAGQSKRTRRQLKSPSQLALGSTDAVGGQEQAGAGPGLPSFPLSTLSPSMSFSGCSFLVCPSGPLLPCFPRWPRAVTSDSLALSRPPSSLGFCLSLPCYSYSPNAPQPLHRSSHAMLPCIRVPILIDIIRGPAGFAFGEHSCSIQPFGTTALFRGSHAPRCRPLPFHPLTPLPTQTSTARPWLEP